MAGGTSVRRRRLVGRFVFRATRPRDRATPSPRAQVRGDGELSSTGTPPPQPTMATPRWGCVPKRCPLIDYRVRDEMREGEKG